MNPAAKVFERNFSGYTLAFAAVFEPFIPGGGPTFVLTTWDTHRRGEYGKRVIAYRLVAEEHGARSYLFEGEDFYCHHSADSNEAIAGLMGFLTLKPGDTDAEYFADYTPEQLDYCNRYAEALSLEAVARYGEG